MSLFPYADDGPTVVELRPGEFAAAVAAYDAVADPRARRGDQVWWNHTRMPAGVSASAADPATVAIMNWVVPRFSQLVDRDVAGESATTGARDALLQVMR